MCAPRLVNYKVGATSATSKLVAQTSAWRCKSRRSAWFDASPKIGVSPTGDSALRARGERSSDRRSKKKKEERACDGNPMYSHRHHRDSPSVVSPESSSDASRPLVPALRALASRPRTPRTPRTPRRVINWCARESSETRAPRSLAAARRDATRRRTFLSEFGLARVARRGVALETRANVRARRRSRGDDRDARVLRSRDARRARGVASRRRATRRENFLDAVAVAGGLASRRARVDEWRDAVASTSRLDAPRRGRRRLDTVCP